VSKGGEGEMKTMYEPGDRCPTTGVYRKVKISIGLILPSQIHVVEDTQFPETNENDIGYVLDGRIKTKRLPSWL
jgi:hypothetical protein